MGILLYNESCKDIIIQFKLFRHFFENVPRNGELCCCLLSSPLDNNIISHFFMIVNKKSHFFAICTFAQ